VGTPEGLGKKIYGPVDIEGHKGTDDRYYVVVPWLNPSLADAGSLSMAWLLWRVISYLISLLQDFARTFPPERPSPAKYALPATTLTHQV
jgi:hypothetical protein